MVGGRAVERRSQTVGMDAREGLMEGQEDWLAMEVGDANDSSGA